jgi:hypothetical protein
MSQTNAQRTTLIDQLERSFILMPRWAQVAALHAMAPPAINPDTGKPFACFREVLEAAADDTLATLRDDFDDNGDLLPAVPTQ